MSIPEFPDKNVERSFQEPEEETISPPDQAAEVSPLEEQPLANEEIGTEPTRLEDLPPEAQGDANGGPLGCCLGVMFGILLSLSIAIISRIYPELFVSLLGEHISIVTRVLMVIVLIAAAIIFGGLGWRLGLRFYREYEPSPRYKRKMAALEARQQAIDRRRARRYKSGKRIS